jgi:hypothetical protein
MKTYKLVLTISEILKTDNYQDILRRVDDVAKQFPKSNVDFRSRDVSYELEHPYIKRTS